MRTIRSLLSLAAVAVAMGGCLTGEPFIPKVEDVYFAPSLNVDLAASTKTASGLYYRDLVVGGGAAVNAEPGDSVGVRYTGWLRNGEEFDSNIAAVGPLQFRTGRGSVIQGFDEGVRGMRVGGRRQLIIPSELGYGGTGSGPIPPNNILIFEVTLSTIYPPVP